MVLEVLHKHKFIYREYFIHNFSLKPENILIDKKGYIRLIDFGLSINLNKSNDIDLIAGTPEYLPP
jgi:cGMP-dependent protein kinase